MRKCPDNFKKCKISDLHIEMLLLTFVVTDPWNKVYNRNKAVLVFLSLKTSDIIQIIIN